MKKILLLLLSCAFALTLASLVANARMLQDNQPDKLPAQCIKRIVGDSDIEWNKNGKPPVVWIRVVLRNECVRPLKCVMTAVSGYKPREDTEEDVITGYSYRLFSFTLLPSAEKKLLGTLKW